ncbi:hypothetical protein M408DRAFT_28179, partial [Serendipita vermifera MAFF 305830]
MRGLFNAAALFAGACSILDSLVQYTFPNVAITSLLGVQAREEGAPQTTINYFEELPTKFHYANNITVFYFDSFAGDVYVSEDSAKSWSPVDGVPSGNATRFIEHPIDSRVAFILTDGTKHYTTRDRGRTWNSFETPMPPTWDEDPLSFHADPKKAGYVMYQGVQCENGRRYTCLGETFYTTDGFVTEAKSLLPSTASCLFGGSVGSVEHDNLIVCHHQPDLLYPGEGSSLLTSSDFFVDDIQEIDFGIGPRLSRRVLTLERVNKFFIAMVSLRGEYGYEAGVYVTTNMKEWNRAHLPYNTEYDFRGGFGAVGEITESVAMSVPSSRSSRFEGLFISDTNGTHYVESMKHIHQSANGPIDNPVDFWSLQGLQGVAFANQVDNVAEIEDHGELEPKLRTMITYNDGASWNPLDPPPLDIQGQPYVCHNRTQACTLHLQLNSEAHTPPTPHGYVIGVGSVSETLLPYEQRDTFLSRDAGKTWSQLRQGAYKYALGDNGNIMVLVNDEERTDQVHYSTDAGATWKKMDLGITLRAHFLATAPEAKSQQFMLIGTVPYGQRHENKQVAVVHLDFTPIQGRQCTYDDVEKWYAHGHETKCIMGWKQWFWRRKSGVDCYMGTAFHRGGIDLEGCVCTDVDFGCDYNHVLEDGQCVPLRPDSIPEGVCLGNSDAETYQAPSGYRLVPGNVCKREGGKEKDKPIMKSCAEEKPRRGEVGHQIFKFPAPITSYYYLGPKTILAQSWSGIWKSLNEGYSWSKISLDTETYTSILIHPYDETRAYLLTTNGTYHYTTDAGRTWHTGTPPPGAKGYMVPELAFHPTQHDYLIWSG